MKKITHPIEFIKWHRAEIAKNVRTIKTLPKGYEGLRKRFLLERENRSHLAKIKKYVTENVGKDASPNKFFTSNPKRYSMDIEGNIHPFPDKKSAAEYEKWLEENQGNISWKKFINKPRTKKYAAMVAQRTMFKVQTTEGVVVVPGGLLALPEMPGHEFIVHRIAGNKGILISEFHTGRGLASGKTRASVIKKARSLLKRIGKNQMDKFVQSSTHLNP